MSTSTPSLYAYASQVPLIISPALHCSSPVKLPDSLHPLPPNLSDYFVYPFSLERFVLDEASRRDRERRERLQRMAPGWQEDGAVLVPRKIGMRPDEGEETRDQAWMASMASMALSPQVEREPLHTSQPSQPGNK